MMLTARITPLFFTGFLLVLPACQERKTAIPSNPETHSLVKLPESGPLDWNDILGMLESEEVLNIAASFASSDPETLARMTRIEVDVDGREIRILGTSLDAKTAKLHAKSLANAYLEARFSAESKRATSTLSHLIGQQDDQLKEMEKGSPLFDQATADTTIDRDRLTYEKAKQALQDELVEEAGKLDDRVLFQKKSTE